MHRRQERTGFEPQALNVLRIALPALLTLAGVWYAWRANELRRSRTRAKLYVKAVSGPTESLPHSDPEDDLIEAASEDSFPASDPPAYTAGDRLGRPAH
jgi:hypothetical protein